MIHPCSPLSSNLIWLHVSKSWTRPCQENPVPSGFWVSIRARGGFPGGASAKESAYNTGDLGSILGLGRSAGGGNGNPLQYSCLKNPFDRGAWWVTVHGVAELDITEHSHTQELLYPHGLAWGWASLAFQMVKYMPTIRETWIQSWVGKSPWRKEWLPTLVFLPGEFYG